MFFVHFDVYIIILCKLLVICASSNNSIGNKNSVEMVCSEIPEMVLEEILGAAFNARYMSINEPGSKLEYASKRKAGSSLDFYVDSQFMEDVEDKPAWVLTNHVEVTVKNLNYDRSKRDLDYLQEWQCESQIKWTDLGPDYFPRYLRSVECLEKNCWFNIYKCRPRSFTVKILRRKRNRCVTPTPGTQIGVSGLPNDLKQLWVWEERAVTFCCDCST